MLECQQNIRGGSKLTGCRHDRFRWVMQSDEGRHGDSHCDGLDEGMRCGHVHNEEARLRVKFRVSFDALKSRRIVQKMLRMCT